MQNYRTRPPQMRERIRMGAMFSLALFVPVLLAGFVMVQLDVPGALYLLAGLFLGAAAREIGQQRMFVLMWPLTRHITDWNKVDELASSPPAAPERKRNLRFAVTIGVAVFAFAVVAAFAVERVLAFAHDPTRNNPPNNVILLSASWCGYCMSLRQHLTELHIPYTDLDVEHTTEGRWAYSAVRGTGVPITVVGDRVIRGVGPGESRWRKIDGVLATAGYSVLGAGSQNGSQRDEDSLVSPVAR